MQNAFIGKRKAPTEKELADALGKVYPIWKDLIVDLRRDLKLDGEEWKTYSIKAGWSLRLLQRKRNIIYLAPESGCFGASLILGDRAMTAAKSANLPARARDLLTNAKRYPEGTAVRIEVLRAKDVEVVKALAKIKVQN